MDVLRKGLKETKYFSDWFPAFLLFFAPFVVYWPSLHGPFVWDDWIWTRDAEWYMSSLEGLWQIWTHPTALQQYYPITGTSFWLDHQFWGYQTVPYHIENTLLHALSSLLFWKILTKLRLNGAWFAAALFAVHPVVVESVAWITERKNVLSMFFSLGAFLSYGSFMRWWLDDGRGPWRWYGLAFLLFVCALLAKITAFLFPLAVLLVGWWKHGRLDRKNDIFPIIPFGVIAIALGYFIRWLEKHHVGAIGGDFELATLERLVLSGQIVWFYLWKLVLPLSLCSIYDRWPIEPSNVSSWLSLFGLLGVGISLWCFRKRVGRGPIVAVLFFVGGLIPVLGFMNVYGMRFSWVADRWVYVPSLAFFIVIAQGVFNFPPRMIRDFVAIAMLTCLSILTWFQAGTYRSVESYWQAAISGNPKPWKAENDFGVALLEQGKTEDAIFHFQQSIRHAPDIPDPLANLGNAYWRAGQFDKAKEIWDELLVRWPDFAAVHYNLGLLLRTSGRIDDAILHFQKAIELVPTMSVAHYDLGNLLFLKGRFADAATHFLKTLEIRPGHPSACTSFGNVLFVQGRHAEALHYYQQSLQTMPEQVEALSNCAWIMSTSPDPQLRDGRRAVEFGEKSVALTNAKDPGTLGTLASAYAEVGRFADAAETATKAIPLAEAQGKSNLAVNLRNELSHYELNKPFRDEVPKP
jgi:tetratricopeptide (TPR) repeat protein